MNRDTLREQWRVAAVKAAEAEDKAARAKQGREIFLDELVETFIEQVEKQGGRVSQAAAERMARTSAEYKQYIEGMHAARHNASLLQIEAENKNRLYWESVSAEATERAERRMSH